MASDMKQKLSRIVGMKKSKNDSKGKNDDK